MFLSSRWGKPSFEIEALPLSEFNKQKAFWEHSCWGMSDDLLAMQYAATLATNSRKKPMEVVSVKRLAVHWGSVRAFVVESTKSVRAAFMAIASEMKKK